MNCANHSEQAALAFCRTCGKPLCNQCTRDVRGVIYCETCLASHLETAAPVAGFTPVQTPYAQTPYTPPQTGYQQFMDQGLGLKVQPGPVSGPNPAVAGILAGFFPIGVGAVYSGQYAKGLAHLVIMVLLIIGQASDVPWYIHLVLGVSMGFFYIYQIIDAIRTAKAVQLGEPAPDPFGLSETFPIGEKFEGAKIPTGAAVLIGLGVLFLLHTAGLFEVGMGLLISLLLIALGVWLFAKHWGLLGQVIGCGCEQCRTRKLMGPAVLVTLGVLFLLDNVSRIGFNRTWPAILLVIGVVKLWQSNASAAGHIMSLPVRPTMPGAGMPGNPPVVTPPPAPTPQNPDSSASSNEVNHV